MTDDDILCSFDWLGPRQVTFEFPINDDNRRTLALILGLERTYDVAMNEEHQKSLDQQRELIEQLRARDRREYARDQPVALDDRDPSNSEIDKMIEPLEPHDNVYTLIHPDADTLRESAPVGDDDKS